MAERRRAAGAKDKMAPPGQVTPTAAEVIAMLASVVDATTRLEGKLDRVLAELASLPRPARHHPPRGPAATHPLRNRLSCRDHRPRPRRARQCAHDRRDH
jgi:hypothetical protein